MLRGVADGRLCSYTLAVALGLSALAGGAVHLPVLALYAVLVVVSGLMSGWVERPGGAPGFQNWRNAETGDAETARLSRRLQFGVGLWLALGVVCWVQALPLPIRWLESVAPLNADVWSRALRPFGESLPQTASLSLAPGRTLVEALKAASYGVAFAVSARLTARNGIRPIVWIVFSCALLVALVTAAHQAAGATELYGLYRPLHASVVGPILNTNSLAGYLNLGVFAGLGLLLRSRQNPANPLIAVGLVLILAEVILCQSRGATGSLLVGLLALAISPWRGRRNASSDGSSASWRRAVLMALIAASAALAALALRQADWKRLADASLEKLDMFGWVSRLAREHGAGIGRGAFGSVFFSYEQQGGNVTYDHAENLPLQWISEWGWCVATAALLGFGWALRPLLGRRAIEGKTLRRCLLVGCGVLVLHNLVDLGLEIPALAALLASALGGLFGALFHDLQRPRLAEAALVPNRWILWGGAALTSVALILAWSRGGETLPRLRQQLFAELAAGPAAPAASFWRNLRSAISAFPADPYFPLLGARAALGSGANAIPWVARALERAPHYGAAHLESARILGARGASDQALGALRRAVELDPSLAPTAVQIGLSWRIGPAALRDAAPEGVAGAPLLRALAERVQDPELKVRWLEEATEHDPTDADTQYLLTSELLRELSRKDHARVCQDRDACLRSARAHAEKSQRPGDPRAVILQAQLLAEQGDRIGAEAQLWGSCDAFPRNVGCAEALVRLAIDNHSARLTDAVHRFVASGCSSADNCSRTHGLLGDLFLEAGQKNMALQHYEEAARAVPTPGSLQRLAKVSRELGHDALADAALRRVQSLSARDSKSPVPSEQAPGNVPAPVQDPEYDEHAP